MSLIQGLLDGNEWCWALAKAPGTFFGSQLGLASLLSLVVIAVADDVHFPFFVYSHFLNTGKQEQALPSTHVTYTTCSV